MYSRDTPKGMIYMDLIKISDTKLKIMLTSSDMTQYDLHNDHISIADIHVRNVLRRLLEKAKEQIERFAPSLNRICFSLNGIERKLWEFHVLIGINPAGIVRYRDDNTVLPWQAVLRDRPFPQFGPFQ